MCPECWQSSVEKSSPQQSPLPPIDLSKGCKAARVRVHPTVYVPWGGVKFSQTCLYDVCVLLPVHGI